MISLDDDQLALVMTAARAIPQPRRARFLDLVAARLLAAVPVAQAVNGALREMAEG